MLSSKSHSFDCECFIGLDVMQVINGKCLDWVFSGRCFHSLEVFHLLLSLPEVTPPSVLHLASSFSAFKFQRGFLWLTNYMDTEVLTSLTPFHCTGFLFRINFKLLTVALCVYSLKGSLCYAGFKFQFTSYWKLAMLLKTHRPQIFL